MKEETDDRMDKGIYDLNTIMGTQCFWIFNHINETIYQGYILWNSYGSSL